MGLSGQPTSRASSSVRVLTKVPLPVLPQHGRTGEGINHQDGGQVPARDMCLPGCTGNFGGEEGVGGSGAMGASKISQTLPLVLTSKTMASTVESVLFRNLM